MDRKLRGFRIPDADYQLIKDHGKGNANIGLQLLIDVIRQYFKDTSTSIVELEKPTKTQTKAKKQSKKDEEPITRSIEQKYKELYFINYNTQPFIGAKERTQLKHVIETVGKDKSLELVDLYFKSSDQYYIKQKHPIYFMQRDATKIFADFYNEGEARLDRLLDQIPEKISSTKAWWEQ